MFPESAVFKRDELQVGITIMYMMVESKIVDPLEVGGHVLAGYLTLMDLTDEEFDALKMCVAGRFAQVRLGLIPTECDFFVHYPTTPVSTPIPRRI